MGEYWIPTNVTKKQFVHPHEMGDGLKLGEWMGRKSATMRRIEQLIAKGRWSNSDDIRDDIRAFSDYGSEIQMHGRLTDGVFNRDGAMYRAEGYEDVSDDNGGAEDEEVEKWLTENCPEAKT